MDSAKVNTPGDYRPTKNRSKGLISMNMTTKASNYEKKLTLLPET